MIMFGPRCPCAPSPLHLIPATQFPLQFPPARAPSFLPSPPPFDARILTRSGFQVIQASRPSEFRTHASDWGDPRRRGQALMHDMEIQNLKAEWIDPGHERINMHDLDMREAGLGSQKNPRRPVAEELHNGVPFR